MDAKQLGQAGLVGWRGRLGRRAADELGRRTRLDAETVAALVGIYLFVSRARRMWQMPARARRAFDVVRRNLYSPSERMFANDDEEAGC